jgi:hypothetical protein
MIDAEWLASTLKEVPEKVSGWRNQALQLRHLVATAEAGGTVSDELLEATEITCNSIYSEIEKFAAVVESVAHRSPDAASQLAPVSDTLHLVLLEVTELSTELYAARSRLKLASTSLLAHS